MENYIPKGEKGQTEKKMPQLDCGKLDNQRGENRSGEKVKKSLNRLRKNYYPKGETGPEEKKKMPQ